MNYTAIKNFNKKLSRVERTVCRATIAKRGDECITSIRRNHLTSKVNESHGGTSNGSVDDEYCVR